MNNNTLISLNAKMKERNTATSEALTPVLKPAEDYRMILDSIQDGYCETDLSGNFTYFNASFTRILGYDTAELLCMNGRDIMEPDTCRQVFRLFRDIYRTGVPSPGFDYEIICKGGSRRQIEVAASLIKSMDGKDLIGFRSIVRDITERKKVEDELRRARDELEKRVEARTAELARINNMLEIKTIKLEEANIALKILLKKKDETKAELEQNMAFNVKELIMPVLEKLRRSGLNEQQKAYAGVMEGNLNDIISPLVHGLTYRYYHLTPKEIQIANMIKQGKTTKEIAALFHLSVKTVKTHRRNIRRKIGIQKHKVNLRTQLQSIQ